MRLYNSISFIFISILLIFSCQENSPKSENKITPIESDYSYLTDYKWLSNIKNFEDENYQKKFKQHFEQSIEENKFEDAAAYLITYGEVLDFKFVHDSIYMQNSIEFYTKNKHNISKNAQSSLSYYIGTQYFRALDLVKSNIWLKKCVEIIPENNSQKKIQGFAHFSIGQNYSRMGKLELAEKHLVNALNIFEEVQDLTNQGTVYLLMHSLYTQNNAYNEAEKFLKKAISIFEKDKNDFLAFAAHVSYVHFYIEQGDTLTTIKQIDKLSEFAKTYKDITDYDKGLLNQFNAFKFIAKKDEDSASYYLQVAREIAERNVDPDLDMRNFFQEILFSKAFDKPLEDVEQAEAFYKELAKDKEHNRQFMEQIADVLFKFYQQKGEHYKANQYAIFLIEDANKQTEERAKGYLFELERKFETEQKEKTILLQEKKLTDKNKIILSMVIITIFIVLISILAFVWSKNKSIIKEKKITENYASQLLQKTEDERKRIASDLHDSVSNELVNLRHAIDNNNIQLKDKIDFILEEVRNVSRNISPILFDKIGLKSSVEQLTERIQNQHYFFISSEIDYKGELGNDKELQLYRIIQEAITNILKHADAIAGKVTVTEDSNFVNVEIKDNGKGFNVDKMIEKGNCFGLLNITERTKFLNGTVNFHSDNKGTIIKISIPK
ncbi:tetratricopeptide repeat-containing sensor histidine kinase [Moheibacter sediminis]|uniref:histidine kinase n=1 Tax=Moheibacter sediminis TaxID=1434700 RepID=A0A1W2BUI6_9FLAO|nr:Histidine kinase [Moheibacter sediminis]